ncbi:FkbM family methyltransferase [Roseimaritima sediminicola]|uniref:FkbM family methyltransferase n=1 Tax=Roseimaritima sediminicola TaxID=2662066 RepID=UPI001298585B|nr:FkbM family methyltransferase [Roseimaritima sediminicola]
MQRTRFRGYWLHYENGEAAASMIRQAEEFPSFFTPQGERPRIIDGGSNIGVSMLEWKSRWPGARVECFEPDPAAFAVLQKNITANDIPGVTCQHAALWPEPGSAPLYGDLGRGGDARGNSLVAAWGNRAASSQTEVPCQPLSTLLDRGPVDFLKLDIEGAEQRVLAEAGERLREVAALYVEVHETDADRDHNSADAILGLLDSVGFATELESRYDPHALPPALRSWQQAVGASQSQILAWR